MRMQLQINFGHIVSHESRSSIWTPLAYSYYLYLLGFFIVLPRIEKVWYCKDIAQYVDVLGLVFNKICNSKVALALKCLLYIQLILPAFKTSFNFENRQKCQC